MAVIFPLPTNVPEAASTGYQRQNTLIYAEMTGYLNITLSDMDNPSAPLVLAGSVFEVNAGLYRVTSDETISGTPSTGQNYVYAVPNAGGCAFQYSATAPTWSAAKGGWYDGNNRAVAKTYYVSSQYNNKVILDSQKAMSEINTKQPVPTSGGTLVLTGAVNQISTATLEPGWYRVDIKAGKGGRAGALGEQKNFGFAAVGKTDIIYGTGGDGGDGYPGLGTGGSGTGGSSFIYSILFGEITVMGGSGAGGDGGYGGGGGAGGYGIGSDSPDNYGKGGRNGVGGNGGGGNAGGGSGYYGGGTGVGSGGKGGGYGESGGDTTTQSTTTQGGDSQKKRKDAFDAPDSFSISYQGGGAGANGGTGGTGLKSTSSGWLRIYRMA
jgi:hypothetical protein